METTEPKKVPAPAGKEEKKQARKKGGCLMGCLIFFVVAALVVGGLVANTLGLFEKWHLVPSRAERVFDVKTPDRAAAYELRSEIKASGVDTKGMDVIVLRKKDGTGSAAVVVLDASKGFSFRSSGSGDPFLNTLGAMAKSEAAKKNGIQAVAFEYKDDKGRALASFGASVKDAADFADGKLTREQFAARVAGKLNVQNLIKAEQDSMK